MANRIFERYLQHMVEQMHRILKKGQNLDHAPLHRAKHQICGYQCAGTESCQQIVAD